MLLHLPIVIMATLAPIPVSGLVPQFDIARECRFEGGSNAVFAQCSRDETTALSQLRSEWVQFGRGDQKICMGETTSGGFASYVELLTCLEIARDVTSQNTNSNAPHARSAARPTRPDQTDVTVGEAHRH